jgi:VanZ family protein
MAAGLTILASLSPRLVLPGPAGIDLLAHALAYAALAVPPLLVCSRGPALLLLLGLGMLGLTLEGAQSFVPGRHPDLLDMLANLCGIVAGILAFDLLTFRLRRKVQ